MRLSRRESTTVSGRSRTKKHKSLDGCDDLFELVEAPVTPPGSGGEGPGDVDAIPACVRALQCTTVTIGYKTFLKQRAYLVQSLDICKHFAQNEQLILKFVDKGQHLK